MVEIRLASVARAAAALIALASGGCALEPAYERPAAPVQADWPADSAVPPPVGPDQRSAAPALQGGLAAADLGWRDFFTDPALQRLIEIALANNRDVRIAAINIAAARSQYQIQRADLFPTIAATAEESVQRTPSELSPVASLGTGTGSATTGSGGNISRVYSVGLGFTSYELDLFGRIRSLSRQRLEQYFGYIETRRSTTISLIAEVANAWLTVLADQELLRVTRDTLASQRDSYEITRRSFEGGVQTGLALRQAETLVRTAEANLALYTRQLAQDRNALTLLLGTPLPVDLPNGAGIDGQRLVEDLPAGVPSDVLVRRPDVLAAEHNLVAANANIGAARAAFFPSITLTGSYGTSSTQLSGLFDSGSRAWSFLPQLNLPIFTGGANTANLALAREQKNLYVAQYEQTVQTAFREVADGLAARGTLTEQLQAQQALEVATRDAFEISDLRFRNGIDNYLNVLDSQRSLYSAQQQLVSVKLARLQNLVTLYKALGGGWNETTGAARAEPGADGGAPDPATSAVRSGPAS